MIAQEQLLTDLGDPYTNKIVERLKRFAYLPPGIIEHLATEALSEQWGDNHFVLIKYLAAHVPWSVEQGRFSSSSKQFYVAAGHLQTRYGTPLYLAFEKNRNSAQQPWCLVHAGSDISAPQLPAPPEIPAPQKLPVGAEIVMMHGHILDQNSDRVPFLKDTPSVAQMCAVAGSIQWSLNRGLQLSYWYFNQMNYLVPLYLQNREDITQAPDLIAPIQVNHDRLLVRTVLAPSMPYANARLAVKRHDQLPAWMLESWRATSMISADQRGMADEEGLDEDEES